MWPITREPEAKVAYSAWSGVPDYEKTSVYDLSLAAQLKLAPPATLNWPHSLLVLRADTLNWPHAKTGKALLPATGERIPFAAR